MRSFCRSAVVFGLAALVACGGGPEAAPELVGEGIAEAPARSAGDREPAATLPTAADAEADADLPPELALLRRILTEQGEALVLYRLARPEHQGSVWTYTEDHVERPDPAIPHRPLGPGARRALGDLTRAADFDGQGGERLLGYGYILEVLDGAERPVARLDFHTEGEGASCIFVVEPAMELIPEGYARLDLSPAGRARWLAALDALWERAGP